MSTQWNQAFAAKSAAPGAVLIGLLGAGIQASRTPPMQRAEAASHGIPFEYRLIDIDAWDKTPELGTLIDRIDAAGYDGINVTHPYKQAVIAHLNRLSPEAARIGAVNTVLFRQGERIGANTDHWGFAESLRRGLPGAARGTVLLIGAGGAGGAVAQALVDAGAGRLLVQDTDRDRAEALARKLGARNAEPVTDLATAAARADGIVNASPVGMANYPGLPLPAELITPRHWVADIVYFPLETELLALARSRGCAVLPGSGMALFQAVRAFELFTGRTPDPERMRKAFDAAG